LLQTFAEPPGVGRPVQVVRSGFRLASGDPGPAMPPPQLGADTNAILAELGYSNSEIDDLARENIT
jgi:crotonobetainyl-CoA:carnitine CoA-transferase CaiB-like acyl-CoA transferase